MTKDNSQQRGSVPRTILFPDLTPLLEVSDALARKDDAALLRIGLRRDDQDTFHEQVRICAETVSYPSDPQRTVFHHARLWMMPIVFKPSFLHALKAPNEEATSAICSYCADWLATEDVDIALLLGLPRYGDIASMSPVALRAVIDGLARLDAPGGAAAAPVTMHASEYAVGVPVLAFVAGIIKQPVKHPKLPDITGERAVDAHRRIDGALSMMCESMNFENGESHSLRLPLPFSEAMTSGLEMWLDALLEATLVRAWDIQHEHLGRMQLVLQVKLLDGSGQEIVLRMPIVQWQVGKEGLERVLDRLASVPLVSGLKDNHVPSDQAAPHQLPRTRH